MIAVKETREKKEVSRQEEQEKRYSNYQKDGELLQVSQLEEEGSFRVDNPITGGAYFITTEGQEKTCTCPDYQNRCTGFNPPVHCKHIIGVNNWIGWKNQEKARRDGKHNFDPHKYLIKVTGKDYLEVKFRLHWFRLEHAAWDIRTEIVNLDLEKGIALVRADIFDEKGNHKSSGLKMEVKSSFGDYAEKAETGAIGRALAALGYGTLQTFDLEEGIEKGRIADAPVKLDRDKGNGKTISQAAKEHEQPQQEIRQEDNGTNGNNGGNGNGKASLKQVSYLKDLCKELNVKPLIELANITREKASLHITNLEKIRLAKSKN
jgi:hypothetical protein